LASILWLYQTKNRLKEGLIMGRMDNRCVVVTGAASGIGEATARTVIAEGGSVVIADLQEARGQALADELGTNAVFIHTDVTEEKDIEAAVALAQSQFGGIHGMVNNAGIVGAIGSIIDTPAEAFDRTMAILSRAVFLGIKHAARVMKAQGSGSIVSIASTAGVMGGLGPHVYTMAKHGVVGLTKSAASELSGYGVRVNSVAPGNTVTDMTSALISEDPHAHEATEKAIAKGSPLGIAGLPQDIANGIVFLLSDEARYVTGHTLVMDAGQTSSGLERPAFFDAEADTVLHAGKRDSTEN
jgi:NAD(P)-dependent dehydrogenase (short-subunit alcohol dehydrogenase family)